MSTLPDDLKSEPVPVTTNWLPSLPVLPPTSPPVPNTCPPLVMMSVLKSEWKPAQIGLALYDGTQVAGECVWHSGLHHTQELAPALLEIITWPVFTAVIEMDTTPSGETTLTIITWLAPAPTTYCSTP